MVVDAGVVVVVEDGVVDEVVVDDEAVLDEVVAEATDSGNPEIGRVAAPVTVEDPKRGPMNT
ncbi:MAG: hypothetical protein ACYC0H_23255 [Solirubrobacteraceae bacterium]